MADDPTKKQRNLEDFVGIASDWFWETDADHRFCYFSSRIEEVTKVPMAAILGKRRDVVSAEDRSNPKWIAHLADLQAHRPFRHFEYQVHRPNENAPLWISVSGEPVFADDGNFLGYRGSAHDITPERIATERLETSITALAERNAELNDARRSLERSANEDALTGLLNRRAFERDIDLALQQTDNEITLLHMDLDRFKWVNDTLGHPAGDQVLTTAATRICFAIGDHAEVYRVGGDEFMIIFVNPEDDAQVNTLSNRILTAMMDTINIGQQCASVSASIGIASAKADTVSVRNLISQADAALYEAKKNGRNTVCRITPALQQQINDRRQLASEIPAAIEREEFVPYFQPQFDVSTGQIVGAEALVRWRHPERGLLLPGAFLQSATELGLLDRIDHGMLRSTLDATARLSANGCPLPSISINVSEARLNDSNLPAEINSLWQDRRCQLCIELLETIYFDETCGSDRFGKNLRQLREIGVSIETDDFGSGRASITGLLRTAPNRLKIDRTLVQEVVRSSQKRSLVRAIIDMATALEIDCIAEGVETQEDIDVVTGLGCNQFQGYLLCRPISEDDLLTFLKTQTIAPQIAPKTKTAGQNGLPRTA